MSNVHNCNLQRFITSFYSISVILYITMLLIRSTFGEHGYTFDYVLFADQNLTTKGKVFSYAFGKKSYQ